MILHGIMLGHSCCLEHWIICLQLQTSTHESWYRADMLALQCTNAGLVNFMSTIANHGDPQSCYGAPVLLIAGP